MRIIGHIEHPSLKITVFKMDNRISVKFENAVYEQTFKLGADERFSSFQSVQKLVDAEFLERISSNFRLMHQYRMAAVTRAYPTETNTVLDEII